MTPPDWKFPNTHRHLPSSGCRERGGGLAVENRGHGFHSNAFIIGFLCLELSALLTTAKVLKVLAVDDDEAIRNSLCNFASILNRLDSSLNML